MPRKFFLTQDSVTGMGAKPAGTDITSLQDNERTALCLMGRAVSCDEKDAEKTQKGILDAVKAAREAAEKRDAEIRGA